jgi:hypothetical protein
MKKGISSIALTVVLAGGLLAFGASEYAGALTPCGKGVKKASAGATCKPSMKQSMKKNCPAAFKSARKNCCVDKKAAAARTSAVKSLASSMSWHESKRLVLTGEYVCGKCSLSKLDFCQGFIKTSDGKLYPLVKNNRVEAMKKAAHASDPVKFEAVTKVRLLNGVKYLEVENFKTL